MNIFLLEDESNSSAFTLQEMPGPTLSLIKVDGINDAISKANESLQGTKSTVTSIFTKNSQKMIQFANNLNTHKLNLNKPTTHMDLMMPHHGKNLLKELLSRTFIDMS